MKVELKEVSKRYTETWVLKKINFTFLESKVYGITGRNGSGKSTLMQIISSQLSPTLGRIAYIKPDGSEMDRSLVFDKITFSAPYISPIDNLTLDESVLFHSTYRSFKSDIDLKRFKEILNFPFRKDQYVKYFSSGMKQRLSLALSLLTQTNLILLDEPGSYLDEQGKSWFYNLLQQYKDDAIVVISSNDNDDLRSCEELLSLD